jgi:hypothetical protein
MRSHFRAYSILLLAAVLFYWKIILVRQYSLLLSYEGANQMYAWFQFLRTSFLHGHLPLWDPFSFAGHPFPGEMQTGGFYPLYLLFLVLPTKDGVMSVSTYHAFYVASHVLAACFMYALSREMKLSVIASLVSGICFSLGGVMARLGEWPHLLESGIWLPFTILAIFRSLRSDARTVRCAWAGISGLAIALSILAGGLHFVFMNAIAAISAVAFDAFTAPSREAAAKRNVPIVIICLAVAAAGGAVQLLSSAEYAHQADRFYATTWGIATDRIPYASIGDNLTAPGISSLLFAVPVEPVANGEFVNPYMGVLPIILAIVAIGTMWSQNWVRYLAGMAVLAFLYALGSFSWLHGVMYALVPYLWMAREPNRFMYLANFALAILAGVGLDAVFRNSLSPSLQRIERALQWVAIGAVVLLLSPAIVKSGITGWTGLSLLLIILSWALLRYLMQRGLTMWSAGLILALILFDLNAFDWGPASIDARRASGQDEMSRLKSSAKAIGFLKSRPQPFRVEVQSNPIPNIGDFYGIESTWGAGVTLLTGFESLKSRQDLLNAAYILKPASASEPGAIYKDPNWKIYERKDAFPRAWIVHQYQRLTKAELQSQLTRPDTDLHQTALFH